MKLILVIALILAVIGSFGDCMPPRRNTPGSSPILLGDLKDYFWVSQEDFDHLVEQKVQMYDQASAEKAFLDVLANVINKNLKMFKQIWDYAYFFENLYAAMHPTIYMDSNDPELVNNPNDDKVIFRMQLIQLLEILSPSYRITKLLYSLLNEMCSRTKINRNCLNRLHQEDAEVNQIYQNFEELFKEFPLEPYVTRVIDLRKAIELAGTRMGKFDAFNAANGVDILGVLLAKYEEIKAKLNAANELNFATLFKATNEIYSVGSQALHNNGASSSN